MTGTGSASPPELLVLHAVRITGMADARAAASRFRLVLGEVEELVLDFEAYGWLARVPSATPTAWSLTEAGRAENERRLAAELDQAEARVAVAEAHAAFVGLNGRLLTAVTDWQLRPAPGDPMAANEHDDWRWDERVLDELGRLGRALVPLGEQLTAALARFDGYAERFAVALGRVECGERRWVDGVGIDSCHRVWFELHEDLLATLGIDRGAQS